MTAALPDSFVRPAIVSDVPFIGNMHAITMKATLAAALGHDLPDELERQITGEILAKSWSDSITAPPSPAYRTLTAVEGAAIVGFAALAPADQALAGAPEDNRGILEILALEVPRNNGRKGHGSRLLSAIAEFAEQDQVAEMQVWIVVGDDAKTRFFQSSGFAPRGIQRSLDLGAERVTEQCWYTIMATEHGEEDHAGHSHS
ncbi:GNAT family N-acetyltransferase [Flaviflexus huanghaiensis]|uniref:GNAT family N-acetyltransferase n=1 Tax=Flaviflexus huanghaiensis TaxID=1111473 RepID=UPI0015F9EEBB|nr:GNAT family N-acetyltransferase [Flaviflexus huanghaiensis]